MKLRSGKKYETADGVVYRVLERMGGISFEVAPEDENQWQPNGKSVMCGPDLIRRHYTKPQPAHKLDLKPGDVVELVAWEDGDDFGSVGKTFTVGVDEEKLWGFKPTKGQRPLFLVVSRASYPKPPS